MISVLCLSFANENEIRMCHDLLLNVHGYLNDVRAKSRRAIMLVTCIRAFVPSRLRAGNLSKV